ncbi:hypothetical protein OMP38_09625 [Cohnella ginsengisoli]|uniref:Uncharacterized protein n=1 Tax=Cohnella ginsengisoli TaxID=425004 RepID=A0A9X4KF96_9BACL|nr:hypothetical protein [Cohnella ginsengisoli]MDG0791099.1 hypothetical protein [Cohnella ginsengisoli]
MNSNNLRTLGVILVITAGLIYTIERVGSTVARSKEIVAMYEIHMFDSAPRIHVTGFWDNGFVPLLAIGGILMIAYSFARK